MRISEPAAPAPAARFPDSAIRNPHSAIGATMSLSRHAVVDWEGNPAPEAPVAPDSMREAGLSQAFVCDLLLKALYTRGTMVGRDMAQLLCLPFKVVKEPLKYLKDEKLIQVDGGDLVGEVSYRFSLLDLGRRRAQEAMEQ